MSVLSTNILWQKRFNIIDLTLLGWYFLLVRTLFTWGYAILLKLFEFVLKTSKLHTKSNLFAYIPVF
jgi:hypothetical protein